MTLVSHPSILCFVGISMISSTPKPSKLASFFISKNSRAGNNFWCTGIINRDFDYIYSKQCSSSISWIIKARCHLFIIPNSSSSRVIDYDFSILRRSCYDGMCMRASTCLHSSDLYWIRDIRNIKYSNSPKPFHARFCAHALSTTIKPASGLLYWHDKQITNNWDITLSSRTNYRSY